MRYVLTIAVMIAVICVPGYAIDKTSAKVNFATPVRAGSSELPAGDYTVTWTGTGPEVQVRFTARRKVVATVPAKLTQADNGAVTFYTQNGAEVDTAQEGSATVLRELRLPHLDLSFEDDAKAAQ